MKYLQEVEITMSNKRISVSELCSIKLQDITKSFFKKFYLYIYIRKRELTN